MSKLETLETVETYSEPVSSGITLPVTEDKMHSEPWSFAAKLKKTVNRFVTWIDGVDVDGQQYWNHRA
ncbi:MAG TPA: hypothetical protein VKE71_10335 [Candidatus Angelobacter sp.]|nr:hypothetical protein [Candidatus Angelobacter sp.]